MTPSRPLHWGRGVAVGPVGRTRTTSSSSLLPSPSFWLLRVELERCRPPAGLAVAGRRPLYPSRTFNGLESLSCLQALPRCNLPLGSSFKFVIASASLASSSLWSWPLFPSHFVLASSARQFQIRYLLSFRVASFSRLLPVGPLSGEVTPPGSAGPRP